MKVSLRLERRSRQVPEDSIGPVPMHVLERIRNLEVVNPITMMVVENSSAFPAFTYPHIKISEDGKVGSLGSSVLPKEAEAAIGLHPSGPTRKFKERMFENRKGGLEGRKVGCGGSAGAVQADGAYLRVYMMRCGGLEWRELCVSKSFFVLHATESYFDRCLTGWNHLL